MNIRVTVLQCCSSKTTTTQKSKTNSISIYINIYINIEVFFGMGGKHFENCNTATLQQRVQSRSMLQLCRAPKASTKSTLQTANSAIKKFF